MVCHANLPAIRWCLHHLTQNNKHPTLSQPVTAELINHAKDDPRVAEQQKAKDAAKGPKKAGKGCSIM